MKYSLYFTELATTDLSSVIDYIAAKLCNTKAAQDMLRKVENGLAQIRSFPYAQQDCKEYLIKDAAIRRLIVDNYVLIYQIDEKEKAITVLRFRYAQMDLTKLEL